MHKRHSLAPITGMDIPDSLFGGDESEDGELSISVGTEGLGGVMLFKMVESNRCQ